MKMNTKSFCFCLLATVTFSSSAMEKVEKIGGGNLPLFPLMASTYDTEYWQRRFKDSSDFTKQTFKSLIPRYEGDGELYQSMPIIQKPVARVKKRHGSSGDIETSKKTTVVKKKVDLKRRKKAKSLLAHLKLEQKKQDTDEGPRVTRTKYFKKVVIVEDYRGKQFKQKNGQRRKYKKD